MKETTILWVKISITPDQEYHVQDLEKYRSELKDKISKVIEIDCKIDIDFTKK